MNNYQTFSRNVEKTMAAWKRRVANMLVRGVIDLVNDAGGIQLVQASFMADETHDQVERFQDYGISSNPPSGSECVAICLGGNRDHAIILAVEDRASRKAAIERSQSEDGDVLLYSLGGQFIRLQAADGKLYIDCPHNVYVRSDETVRLEGKNIELSAAQMIKWNVGGRGFNYFPTHTDTYETCTVPGATLSCQPPEHAPAPSETPL